MTKEELAKVVLATLREISHDGRMEVRHQPYGPRPWTECAYENWAAKIAEAVDNASK